MARVEASDHSVQSRALVVNRLTAVAMVFVTAAVLTLLRPDLFFVFIGYVTISVYSLSLARRFGIMVKPCPVAQQNFAAYVAISSLGFVITLTGAPEMIALMGSALYGVIAVAVAIFLVHAIVKSL